MNLLIDIGNSNFKWCESCHSELKQAQGFLFTEQTFVALLNDKLFTMATNLSIEQVLVCSVASETINTLFSTWLKNRLSKTAVYFKSSSALLGVQNAYPEASNLGNDRWLALVYAFYLYQSDVCIIDCGTAITIDVILKNGLHQGGLIAPGYYAQISALEQHTTIVNNQRFVNQHDSLLLHTSTTQCIAQGCRAMALGFITDVVGKLKKQYQHPDELSIVVIGGDSSSLAEDLPTDWHYEQDFMFRGLHYISQHQSELN